MNSRLPPPIARDAQQFRDSLTFRVFDERATARHGGSDAGLVPALTKEPLLGLRVPRKMQDRNQRIKRVPNDSNHLESMIAQTGDKLRGPRPMDLMNHLPGHL